MPDHPAFEHWQRTELNEWAHSAYAKLQEQARTIEWQRLALRKYQDDWK